MTGNAGPNIQTDGALLQGIAESIAAPLVFLRPDGSIEVINHHLLSFFGKTREEMEGWKASEIIHPDDRPLNVAALQKAIESGEPYEVEARRRRYDGVYRWWRSNGYPMRDEDGRIIRWCVLYTDIHDNKVAEEELRRQEFLMASMLESIGAPMSLWTPAGHPERINRLAFEYFGRAIEETEDWAAIVHPEDHPAAYAEWRSSVETGLAYNEEVRLLRVDGVYRWHDVRRFPMRDSDGSIARWCVIQIDIDDRKRAEEALAASEEKFEKIISTIPAMAWTANPDGSSDFFNQHHLDYVGRELKDMQGIGFISTFHPDDVDRLMTAWQVMLETGRAGEVEGRIRRSDGEYRWCLFRTNPQHDTAGRVIKWFGVNIDMEDRKRAEEALRASELHLRRQTETIPQMLWSATAEGNIDYCNERLLEYSGLTTETVMNGGWVNLLHPDDRAPTARIWMQCIATGEPYIVEVRQFHVADNAHRWVLTMALPLHDADGQIVKWYGSCVDIHDRKLAEEALKASEKHLSQFVATIPQNLFGTNPAGSVNYLNPQMQEWFGRAEETIMAEEWMKLVHPDDLESTARAWLSAVAAGTPYRHQVRFLHRSGEYRWCDSKAHPLRNAAGQIVAWHGVVNDISDLKHAEEALRSTQSELAHVTRVMTMGQLTASIAHELNQPLSGIMTNAGTGMRMLNASPPNVSGAIETVRRTIRDAERASDVITRLRSMFAKGPVTEEVVDINAATLEVIALAANEMQRKGVRSRVELQPGLPTLKGDRIQLQQVMLNLLLNAAEAMEGSIERELCISTEMDAEGLILVSVHDCGTGFHLEMVEKIFDPFFTTKESGMGIGLAVSRAIVENHKGRLWAENNEGPGATFRFSIPTSGVDPHA